MGKYWVQADAALIDADDPVAAIGEYRRMLAIFQVACSTGKHCDALQRIKLINPETYARLIAEQQRGSRDTFTASMEA